MLSFGDRINEMAMNESFLYIVHVPNGSSISMHYCGIFLGRFLITIVLNIISSLHIVFSLCARVGWCDICTDFTDLIKVNEDVDVNEMSLLNISHVQYPRNN